jgi:hypothetical protein
MAHWGQRQNFFSQKSAKTTEKRSRNQIVLVVVLVLVLQPPTRGRDRVPAIRFYPSGVNADRGNKESSESSNEKTCQPHRGSRGRDPSRVLGFIEDEGEDENPSKKTRFSIIAAQSNVIHPAPEASIQAPNSNRLSVGYRLSAIGYRLSGAAAAFCLKSPSLLPPVSAGICSFGGKGRISFHRRAQRPQSNVIRPVPAVSIRASNSNFLNFVSFATFCLKGLSLRSPVSAGHHSSA